MDDVSENDQCLFYAAVNIILMADTKEELDSMTKTVETIIANGKRGTATWLYIDERHVLFNSDYSAK